MLYSRTVLVSSAFVLIVFTGVISAKTAVPSGDQCLAKSPELEKCLTKVGQKLFVRMTKGFKEVGIPPMDPLMVTRMSLRNGDGPVSLNLDLIDAKHNGMAKSQITGLKAEPEKYQFELNTTVPTYNIQGTYNVSGKIIMLPIQGTGPSDITFTDIHATWRFKGEPITKNSKKYMKLTEFKVILNPSLMKVQLDNLFNGNKQLGDTMNRFMNENWEEIFKQLKSVMEESFSQILFDLGSRAFNKIPYSNIFPDLS